MPPTDPKNGTIDKNIFELKHDEAMQRAVDILSTLTFSRGRMFGDAIENAAGMLPTGAGADPRQAINSVTAKSSIHKLLDKCWSMVEKKIKDLWWVGKIKSLFNGGVVEFLKWAKQIILSDQVLAKLIPFYGSISGIIEGALNLADSFFQGKAINGLAETKLYLHEGYPVAALTGFVAYAKKETAKLGGKGIYKFGVSVASLIGQVFSFGWTSAVDFAAALVGKLTDIAIKIIEAKKFEAATERLIEYRKNHKLPSAEVFEDMLEACPFLGCVFFAVADKIGPDHIGYTFVPQSGILTQTEINTARGKLRDVINSARKYIREAGISLEYRNAADKDLHGDPLKSTGAEYVGSRGMSSIEFTLRKRGKLNSRNKPSKTV